MVLRQRPLPDGIEPLLQVAAGISGPALADAVARSGESAESVQELVRFYLREVLFHSGADAYRVLGLRRDAGAEQIKAHHRWLQQWLHPDRQSSDWDAIFAGRVNAAWNRLRNDERRRAYDAEHPETPTRAVPEMAASGGAGWVPSRLEPDSPNDRWKRRAPLLALLVACGGLGILAIRDVSRDEVLQGSAVPAGSQSPPPTAEIGTADAATVLGDLHFPTAVSVQGPTKPTRDAVMRGGGDPVAGERRVSLDDVALGAPPPASVARVAPSVVEPQVRETEPSPAKTVSPNAVALLPRARPVEIEPPRDIATVAAAPAREPMARPEPARPVVSAERVKLAQSTGGSLLAFLLRRSDAIPPIWDDLSTQRDAIALRNGLPDGDRRSAPTPPSWRVGERNARMSAELHYPDGRRARIAASLVWREQRWLVNDLTLGGEE